MNPNDPALPTRRRDPYRAANTLGRLIVPACIAAMSALANAAPGCTELPYDIDESKYTLGPKHHPMGRPLPATAAFNQPDQCDGAIRFFDQNHNGRADPAEVRVFGARRQVDCGSCHGESAEALSPQSAALFLRQNAATLCLVCHKI